MRPCWGCVGTIGTVHQHRVFPCTVLLHKLPCGGFCREFTEHWFGELVGLGFAVVPGKVDSGTAAVRNSVEGHNYQSRFETIRVWIPNRKSNEPHQNDTTRYDFVYGVMDEEKND